MTGGLASAEKMSVVSWLLEVFGSDVGVQHYYGASRGFRFFSFRPRDDVARPYGWISEHRVTDASADGLNGQEHLIDIVTIGPAFPPDAAQGAIEALSLAIRNFSTPALVPFGPRVILARVIFLRSLGTGEGGIFQGQLRVRLLTEQ